MEANFHRVSQFPLNLSYGRNVRIVRIPDYLFQLISIIFTYYFKHFVVVNCVSHTLQYSELSCEIVYVGRTFDKCTFDAKMMITGRFFADQPRMATLTVSRCVQTVSAQTQVGLMLYVSRTGDSEALELAGDGADWAVPRKW